MEKTRTFEEIFYRLEALPPCFQYRTPPPVHKPQSLPLDIELAGISYCAGNYGIRCGTNNRLTVLLYVKSGRGFLHTPVGEFEPSAGDVFLVHPGMEVSYHTDRKSPWTLLWFNLRGTLPPALLECYGLKDVFYVPNCPVESEFQAGLDMLRDVPDGELPRLPHFVLELIQTISNYALGRLVNRDPEDPVWNLLRKSMDNNFRESINLEELAQRCGRSVSQVVRICRKFSGMTPHQYLLERRFRIAQLYLNGSSRSIKEIARETGFRDQLYFSRFFRQKSGMSPGAWRRRAWQSREKDEKVDFVSNE